MEEINFANEDTFLNDDVFSRMVAEEVKNKISPLHKKKLMDQENWERWKNALVALSENLEEQINEIEQDAESDIKRYSALGSSGSRLSKETSNYYNTKAIRIRRFKFHVDNRLDEICLMIETGKIVQNDGWEQVSFLRRAIVSHRDLFRKFDLEDSIIDRALWSTLDNRWEFDSITSENI